MTRKSAALSLQESIFQRLKKHLDHAVYDQPPQNAKFPYVTLGEDTVVDWSTKLAPGEEITHTLHIWSQYPGMQELKTLIDQTIQALTISPLVISGFDVVVSAMDGIQTLRDPDGITRHGVLRFRFKVSQQKEA